MYSLTIGGEVRVNVSVALVTDFSKNRFRFFIRQSIYVRLWISLIEFLAQAHRLFHALRSGFPLQFAAIFGVLFPEQQRRGAFFA